MDDSLQRRSGGLSLAAPVFVAGLFLPVFVFLAGARGAEPANEPPGPWPQWRGPEGLGVSSETDLPVVWSKEGKNIKWRYIIVGRGYIAPD